MVRPEYGIPLCKALVDRLLNFTEAEPLALMQMIKKLNLRHKTFFAFFCKKTHNLLLNNTKYGIIFSTKVYAASV